MLDYEKLYHKLFNDITDIIWLLEKPQTDKNEALEKLKQSQIDAEEMYLDMTDDEEYDTDEE